jgi:hypothetical protein
MFVCNSRDKLYIFILCMNCTRYVYFYIVYELHELNRIIKTNYKK